MKLLHLPLPSRHKGKAFALTLLQHSGMEKGGEIRCHCNNLDKSLERRFFLYLDKFCSIIMKSRGGIYKSPPQGLAMINELCQTHCVFRSKSIEIKVGQD
ncbi:hypothetical protein XELAEV_18026004mg [Xenopus laevis]|uniref:Uncharacterized protein n=1 Tax=Xenopus laevis TaxID=8355 RepID=A0A974HMB8_XENLA|nr:hypothetical protein XELAEV_18026004mg [Xenopus laevis]